MSNIAMVCEIRQICPSGWIEVITPLGASAHVVVGSAEHELCEEWRMLTSGRFYLLNKTNFHHWFAAAMESASPGLVAELLLANRMESEALELLRRRYEAREHLLALPSHSFDLDYSEWEVLGRAADLARIISTAEAAALTSLEMTEDLAVAGDRLAQNKVLRQAVVRSWSGSKNEHQAAIAALAIAMGADS